MRVFLINIRDPEFFTVARGLRTKNGNIRIIGSPPIGIMTLSAVLKRAGHECIMFDQANPETPNKVIVERIQKQKPDLIGLSFLSTTSYPYAKTLAHQIRAANVKMPLAFGGTFATINADLIKLQCPEVDFVCRGDGEQLILDLVEHLDDPSKVHGITWAKDGQIVRNPDRAIDNDLDQWPFPDRESLPLEFVKALPLDVPAVLSKKRFTVMQTSRGCPQACVFCTIPTISKRRWRARSPQHVISELKHLQNLGYGVIYFIDDNFLLQSKRIEEICKGINDNNINIEWG
ncbi:MAG: B12-binding domain-containing radical SAM protein, partial [Candidatus Omnitrophica bacterium]|nr:B12-binding domain-containing radical SAM protein [Candidatus Omnitrophota bacterium]